MRLFIVVMPEDVNSHLACYGGKILAHLPNYTECSVEMPVIKDNTKQVFAIFPTESDINRVDDGGKRKTYLWRGSKDSRHQAGELVSVEIQPVSMSQAAGTPVDVAKAALAEYPEPVRFAGVVAGASAELLSSLPGNTAQLKAWADQTLGKFMTAKA